MSKMLYHYTSRYHLKEILESGRLKRTCSNLLKPRDLQVINGRAVDPATDGYHPVVWLTDSSTPENLGLDGAAVSKSRIRFSIPKKAWYKRWGEWAVAHNIEKDWRRALTKGMNWKSWYISELEIPLDDVAEIADIETGDVIQWKKSA